MPYIESSKRATKPCGCLATPPTEAGELAYEVTRHCMAWLDRQPKRGFLAFATCIGVLICVVLEIYRRVVAPYEDLAKVRNGDVGGLGR